MLVPGWLCSPSVVDLRVVGDPTDKVAGRERHERNLPVEKPGIILSETFLSLFF